MCAAAWLEKQPRWLLEPSVVQVLVAYRGKWSSAETTLEFTGPIYMYGVPVLYTYFFFALNYLPNFLEVL